MIVLETFWFRWSNNKPPFNTDTILIIWTPWKECSQPFWLPGE